MSAVLCALGSALLYAWASVLQQRGAATQPPEQALRLSLLARLASNRMWLAGVACDVVGYALQFEALGRGAIAVVQPLLVCGLLFALPIGAAVDGRRLGRRDWVGAVLVCAGLAVFLVVAAPNRGHSDVGAVAWAALLATTAGAAVAVVGLSRGRVAWLQALLLSGGAGIVYGAAAALTKTSAFLLRGGVVHLCTHWQPYVLLVFGVAGMVIAQSAFQAGALEFSLPTMTVADPVVSIVIGAAAFGESVATRPLALAAEIVALAAMTAGVALLALSESAGGRDRRGGLGADPSAIGRPEPIQ